MAYLRHDSGGPSTLKNEQVLGDDSPLEFDGDGYAGPVDDDDATIIEAMHSHVSVVWEPADSDATPGVDPSETGSQDGDSGTCEEIVESTGEVCGRDLPCPYHS